jgi:cytochrome c biogenesis protein CcmG/thiol:disulfide interchange protein DsbE
MKLTKLIPLLLLICSCSSAFSQQEFPNIELKQFDNTPISSHSFADNGRNTLFIFWVSWQLVSRKKLQAIQDLYDVWTEKYNVEIIAVSVDDERTLSTAIKLTEDKRWKFTSISDPEKKLMQSWGVINLPHAVIFDQSGKLVYSKVNFDPGDALILEDELKNLLLK